jgi:hypothetical protein
MVFAHIAKNAWTVQQLASSHFALFGREALGGVTSEADFDRPLPYKRDGWR